MIHLKITRGVKNCVALYNKQSSLNFRCCWNNVWGNYSRWGMLIRTLMFRYYGSSGLTTRVWSVLYQATEYMSVQNAAIFLKICYQITQTDHSLRKDVSGWWSVDQTHLDLSNWLVVCLLIGRPGSQQFFPSSNVNNGIVLHKNVT